MLKTIFKKSISIALAFAALLLLSCCGASDEDIIDETITKESTSAEAETTTETLSDEELDALAQNMPEIVFVMSHHYDEVTIKTNILGFYITNTGEMKMYDFRKIAPDEMYEIPDVYDRLEEATCSELIFKTHWANSENITESDMISITQEELVEYYQKLLLVTGESEYIELVPVDMITGDYRYYGISNNPNGEKECILLHGNGNDHIYRSDDIYINEISSWIRELFPDYLIYFLIKNGGKIYEYKKGYTEKQIA